MYDLNIPASFETEQAVFVKELLNFIGRILRGVISRWLF
jgi:hypothetical protein